ncbi:hypothetical protein F0U61_50735 [Archangium violaceum]|uniref:hypothetical protein n=1 Tax=Archangium violaceum TaxID=83451 RepID=UPI002B2D551D|nr:hypothetical protein F0U61_50735 [Archangium violaceum]
MLPFILKAFDLFEVLVHIDFPSKLTMPNRKRFRLMTFASTSWRTCLRTVSRNPAVPCLASSRYKV